MIATKGVSIYRMQRNWMFMKILINHLYDRSCHGVPQGATTEDFEDQNKRHGYALGANYGRLLKQNGVEVDLDMFFQGMKDYIADQSLMEDADIAAATKEINELVSQRRKAEQDRIAGENLEKGKPFWKKPSQRGRQSTGKWPSIQGDL